MKDNKRLKKLKSNNKGAALVTVIVVIAFICILTTLILYLSVMNYQMKSTDYKTKVSFYGAEEPLEELRVWLAEDISACSANAYKSVMAQYSALSSMALRKEEYEKILWESIQDLWTTRINNPLGNDPVTDPNGWCYGVASVLREQYNHTDYPHKYHVILDDAAGTVLDCGNTDCHAPYHVIIKNLGSDQLKMVTDTADPSNHYMLLSGIKVSYTENGFSSVISTDFCMNIPNFDWSVNAYSPTWGNPEDNPTTTRTQIFYEKCVVYMNYMKQ